jgi:hypothetical protein
MLELQGFHRKNREFTRYPHKEFKQINGVADQPGSGGRKQARVKRVSELCAPFPAFFL